MNLKPLASHQPPSEFSKLQEKLLRSQTRCEQLEADNVALRKENTALKTRVIELETQVTDLTSRLDVALARIDQLAGMVWKANKKPGSGSLPKPDRPVRTGSFRPNPPEASVTERHSFFLETCPDCGQPVGPSNRTTVAFQEDIVLAPPPSVVKYEVGRHWCNRCGTHVKHPHAPDLYAIRRIGPQVLGFILFARYRLGLTLPKIRESLQESHGFTLSEGEVVAQFQEAATLFGADYAAICDLVKSGSHVHADETGWRVEGKNWWLWVFATPDGTVRFVLDESRGREVAKEALGEGAAQIVSSDFYNVYVGLEKEHQYCWAHLAREAKTCSKTLYAEVSELYERLRSELEKPRGERDGVPLGEALSRIAKQAYPDPEPGTARKLAALQVRLAKHAEGYLTCLKYEGIPPDNNYAERKIRPQVIQRKVFGGCRSKRGAKTHAVNTSVLATLRAKTDVPFFEAIQLLVQSRLTPAPSAMD